MSSVRAIVLVFLIGLSGCAFVIVGKDNFKARAYTRTAEFSIGYQTLFRCFTEKTKLGSTGVLGMSAAAATAQLYSDLRLAEYRHADRDAYFSLIEFDGARQNITTVRAFDVLESNLDDLWLKIESCSRDVVANHFGTHR